MGRPSPNEPVAHIPVESTHGYREYVTKFIFYTLYDHPLLKHGAKLLHSRTSRVDKGRGAMVLNMGTTSASAKSRAFFHLHYCDCAWEEKKKIEILLAFRPSPE